MLIMRPVLCSVVKTFLIKPFGHDPAKVKHFYMPLGELSTSFNLLSLQSEEIESI